MPPLVPEVMPVPPPATLTPDALHVPAGPVIVPVKVGDADITTLPVPVITYSPSTPALSNNTRVVVPLTIDVVPTVRLLVHEPQDGVVLDPLSRH